jgi:hypothetical protein
MHIDTIRFPGNVLGADGLVIDGKGEGMYIGALCAARSV